MAITAKLEIGFKWNLGACTCPFCKLPEAFFSSLHPIRCLSFQSVCTSIKALFLPGNDFPTPVSLQKYVLGYKKILLLSVKEYSWGTNTKWQKKEKNILQHYRSWLLLNIINFIQFKWGHKRWSKLQSIRDCKHEESLPCNAVSLSIQRETVGQISYEVKRKRTKHQQNQTEHNRLTPEQTSCLQLLRVQIQSTLGRCPFLKFNPRFPHSPASRQSSTKC